MSSNFLLETKDLVKHFGGVAAIETVNFVLAKGELRCVIGPNGAGKSTFFKLLTGQYRPDHGRIVFRDRDITGASTSEISRLGIGIKMQVPSLFEGLDVRENLRLSARRKHGRHQADRLVEKTLKVMGLAHLAGSQPRHLAHGQRALVELGIVLASEPDLLLLDEPTAGMTSDEVVRTAGLIQEINRTKALIVVEHDIRFIKMIANRVTVFHRGTILIEDTMDGILHNATVRDIYLGRQAQA